MRSSSPIFTPHLATRLRRQAAETLSSKRLTHVLGVEAVSCFVAATWGVDTEKALLAALLHDLLKQRPSVELRQWLDKAPMAVSAEDLDHPQLWHGVAAAAWAVETLDLQDDEILQAVAWHTTGAVNLGPVGLTLFVADYIEPSRQFSGVHEIRNQVLSCESAMEAATLVARSKLESIARQGKALHSRTLQMTEWLESLQPSTPLATSQGKE